MLTVAVPVLKQQGALGARFVSEKPIKIECPSVTFSDGAPVMPENIIQAGFVMRRHQAGGLIESWDESAKQWVSNPNIEPLALFHKDNRWQAVIVAMGQKDQANQDKFSTDRATTLPQYSVQCIYRARDSGKQEHAGVSAGSAPVQISAAGGENRAGLYMKPNMDPVAASEIGMFLKDAALVTEQGRISIREEAGGFRIELLCSGSRIDILQTGEIVLTPRAGQPVRIVGNLNVEGIVTAVSYLP